MRENTGFIEAFFYGNIDALARNQGKGSDVGQCLDRVLQAEEALEATMTPSQKALFRDYQNLEREFSALIDRDGFIAGFRLGGQCVYDIFVKERGTYYL